MIRKNVWLVAGTSLQQSYPCRCPEKRDRWACEHGRCPCFGRIDVMRVPLPAACCAWHWPGLTAALLANVSRVG